MNIQWQEVAVSILNPSDGNPRTIKDKSFKDLVKSIENDPDFLKARPLIVSTRDGLNVVVAGNMRLRAVKSLGWPTVPAILADLTERQENEWMLKDNLHKGEFDWDALANSFDPDFLKDVGFDEKELDKILGKKEVVEDDFDAEAELANIKEPITKPGDIWQLGGHFLMCGDSTKKEDVERLMEGKKADMCLMDPPYGMNLDTDFSDLKGSMGAIAHGTAGRKYDRVIGDNADFKPELITTIFDNFGYCKEIFLFGGDYFAEYLVAKNEGSWLVWDKRKESQAEAIGAEFELCWSKAKHKRRMLRHDWFGFLSSGNSKEARNREHPTQKPTSLMRDILEQWGSKDDLVADLYLGSGSTLIACEQTNRICYGMEIDPKYCDVIIKRWEALTGSKAVLC